MRVGTRHHGEFFVMGTPSLQHFLKSYWLMPSPNDWPIVAKHANTDELERQYKMRCLPQLHQNHISWIDIPLEHAQEEANIPYWLGSNVQSAFHVSALSSRTNACKALCWWAWDLELGGVLRPFWVPRNNGCSWAVLEHTTYLWSPNRGI